MGTSIDYDSVSHETIYDHITGGPGSAALGDVSWDWQSVTTKLQALQDLVGQAVGGIGAAQQGAAADQATHATMALIPWLGDVFTAANGAAAQVSEQAALFAYTRDSMPAPHEVPEVSFSQDPGSWMADHAVEWLPGIQTEHERAQVAAQQAEQRARELMSGYQGASNENLAVRPHFPTAPAVVFEVAPPAPGSVGVGANGGWSTHQRPAHSGPAHPVLTYSALAHSGPVAGEHGVSAPPAATAPQLASSVHQVSAPAPTVPQVAGGYPNPGEELMGGSDSAQPAAAAPFGPSPILAGSGAVGGDRIRSGSRLSGGGVSRDGGFGPRPSTAFDSPLGEPHLGSSPGLGSTGHSSTGHSSTGHSSTGHSSTGHSSTGHSSTGHSSTGHSSTEQANAGRAARGGPGWADAPLGATGGSGRAGGTEHRRPSYLIEQDTSAIVGELPRVAPPVIGAEEDYR